MFRAPMSAMTPIATLLVALTVALPTVALAQDESWRFLPPEREVMAVAREINLTAERFGLDRSEWDEAAGYTLPDERGRVVYTLVMYSVTMRSPQEARELYVARTRQLELDNEVTHSWNTPRMDALGMDDSRDFRVVYVDAASRSRSGEYARLIRMGPTVSLIEVVGSPELDDEGGVDRDRLAVMLGVTQLVARRMVEGPQIAPTNNALHADALMALRLPGISLSAQELIHESFDALQRIGLSSALRIERPSRF